MISISNRLSFLFFCRSFRGYWMVAEWPWSCIHVPKWCSNMRQQLIGGLMLLFSAEKVYYLQLSTDLLSLSSLFLQWKVLFLHIWWLVSSLWAIVVAVAERYDLTLWQGIITNTVQLSWWSELNIMRVYFPRRKRWSRSKKSSLICPQVKMLMQMFLLLLVHILSLIKQNWTVTGKMVPELEVNKKKLCPSTVASVLHMTL